MKKVLLYLDAENLSREQIRESVNDVKSKVTKNEIFSGKFYGNKDVICNIFHLCYSLGLDFIETSSISGSAGSNKNVADMKITVDCICDVVSNPSDVCAVYLISQDKDFLPLVYKLICLDVACYTPLIQFDASDTTKQKDSLAYLLQRKEFSPKYNREVLGKPVQCAISYVGEKATPAEVKEYFTTRRKKLIYALSHHLSLDSCKLLENVDITEFGIEIVLEQTLDLDFEVKCTVVNIFTSKMFGFTYGNALSNVVTSLLAEKE